MSNKSNIGALVEISESSGDFIIKIDGEESYRATQDEIQGILNTLFEEVEGLIHVSEQTLRQIQEILPKGGAQTNSFKVMG